MTITLYFLQASRSIRTAWLLEELGLAYDVKCYDRVNQKAPVEFKEDSGNPLGKAPYLIDDSTDSIRQKVKIELGESGAITDYLLETYDHGKLLPTDPIIRSKVRQWIHAAEGTFMVHGLAILYARWMISEPGKSDGTLDKLEEGMSVNVQKDLDWLEKELGKSKGEFLVGENVTAADTMMAFSIQFIFARALGVRSKQQERWERIGGWLKSCEERDAYKAAVQKTGHTLYPS